MIDNLSIAEYAFAHSITFQVVWVTCRVILLNDISGGMEFETPMVITIKKFFKFYLFTFKFVLSISYKVLNSLY